jgi:hypothetical protein
MSQRNLDPVSLVFGVVFAASGAVLLANQAGVAVDLRWVWPVALIALAVGLLAWVGLDRSRSPRRNQP